jgi:two-component system, OmpR family, sensor histidine kinase ChvG
MRLPSTLAARLLLFNVLLVFLPVAGFLYLDVFEAQLLADQERAMVQQGRLLAAALAEQGEPTAAAARALLARLGGRLEARLRVVDRRGALLADSSLLGPRLAAPPAVAERSYRPAARGARASWVYRLGAALYGLARRLHEIGEPMGRARRSQPPAAPPLDPEVVRAALAGRYGAATRPTSGGERSLTLYSAIPIRSGGQVVGAVVVSQSTARPLAALYAVRLDVFQVFLASLAVAAVLSLLVSATIARPLRRLRDEAHALVDRRGRLRGSFRGSSRADEIGDLARALESLTRRLEGHLRFTESFAADVSHEFKNPLAAIRSATELLAEVEAPADRERLLGVAQREVARLERLLSGVREITEIDARLEAEAAPAVALDALLAEVVAGLRPRAARAVAIDLGAVATPILVRAAPERLAQAFENVIDNALGFSPDGATVTVTITTRDGVAVATVDDRGPGIPEAHRERVFDRFFRYRPGAPKARDGHTGLGLAIARAIVEGYGGTIAARDRAGGGASFEIRLPVAGSG